MSTPVEGLHVHDERAVRWIALDRPDCKNGLTPEIVAAMADAIDQAASARAIVITGRNAAFCSGLDLRIAMSGGADLLQNAEQHLQPFQRLIRTIVNTPKAVIASIDGPAAGFGCDLAFACDLRIASTRAYFQEAFIRIGLVPDGAGTYMLPRLVGLSKALELALLGEKLDATSAMSLGLLAKIVDAEALAAETTTLANRVAASAPMAVARIKRLMRESLGRDFTEAMKHEGNAQLECLRSQDLIEGVMAFFQKRAPDFKGE
jgi:enoyl-CoA hydratase/carnithine racemase